MDMVETMESLAKRAKMSPGIHERVDQLPPRQLLLDQLPLLLVLSEEGRAPNTGSAMLWETRSSTAKLPSPRLALEKVRCLAADTVHTHSLPHPFYARLTPV